MKNLLLLIFLFVTVFVNAQSIVGKWETYDDKTGEKKSIVEIYKEGDKYFGKIVKKFVGEPNSVCDKCTDERKDKPIIGLIIIKDLNKDGNSYKGGTILDPQSGDTYSCELSLVNGLKLKVRGYMGISLLGRTQYWLRTE